MHNYNGTHYVRVYIYAAMVHATYDPSAGADAGSGARARDAEGMMGKRQAKLANFDD